MNDIRMMGYDPRIAADVGLNAAAVFNVIADWIKHNRRYEEGKERKPHRHDGRWWTYGSVSRYQKEDLWFLTEKQVRTALEALSAPEDAEGHGGYLLTGCYNAKAYDRTTWYALSPKGEKFVFGDEAEQRKQPKPRTRRCAAKADDLTPDIMRVIDKWNTYPELTHIDPRGLRLAGVQDIQLGIDTYGIEDFLGIIDTFYHTCMGWYATNENTNYLGWLMKKRDGKRNISRFADEWATIKARKQATQAEEDRQAEKRSENAAEYLIELGIYDPVSGEFDAAAYEEIRGQFSEAAQKEIAEKYLAN